MDAGHVSLTIADHVYEGRRGDVFFVAGEELHEIRAAGRENQFRSFVFAADFLQFARSDQARPSVCPAGRGRLWFVTCLPVGQPGQPEVRALLAQIVRACLAQAPGSQLAVKAALLESCSLCAERFAARAADAPERGLQGAPAQGNRGLSGRAFHGTGLSLPGGVAAQFGLSPQYFSSFFRENFGRTFVQHVNSLRIEQAARLLRETDLPVMEIGFNVGFDNFSYFIKRFREEYGASPSNYRKNGIP